MTNRFSRFKPGVSRKTLLMLSALFWSLVGIMLISKGVMKLTDIEESVAVKVLIFGAAICIGTLKSHFILDKSASRGMKRILEFKDGTCLGAIYSTKTWGLVLCMMGLGVILRNSAIPGEILCFIYFTIGWALVLSSRLAWKVWRRGK
jgi:hypothetical protein